MTAPATATSRPRGRPIIGAERVTMGLAFAARYVLGESVSDLARSTGRPTRWIRALLTEAGVALRRR